MISGDSPLISTWDESAYFIAQEKEDKKVQRFGFMQNEMGAVKKYLVGNYIKGALDNNVQGLSLEFNESSGISMTNLQEHESFTFILLLN